MSQLAWPDYYFTSTQERDDDPFEACRLFPLVCDLYNHDVMILSCIILSQYSNVSLVWDRESKQLCVLTLPENVEVIDETRRSD